MMWHDTIEGQEGAARCNLSVSANDQQTSTRGRVARGC
jgi:hypothetical protein